MMTCTITYPGIAPFNLTAVYASNVVKEKESLLLSITSWTLVLLPGL